MLTRFSPQTTLYLLGSVIENSALLHYYLDLGIFNRDTEWLPNTQLNR
jgi:hypothetical protein